MHWILAHSHKEESVADPSDTFVDGRYSTKSDFGIERIQYALNKSVGQISTARRLASSAYFDSIGCCSVIAET